MSIKAAQKWRKDYYFDRKEAARVVRFFTKHLRHSKGEMAGQPLVLEKWQRKITRRFFGWKRRSDGGRKFKTLFIFIPKKNGKTTWGAGLALYALHADREKGAEIFSVAASKEQAAILFDIAKDMNDGDALLFSLGKSFRSSIYCHKSKSVYKVVSSDAKTKHGPNLHGIFFDELHTQDTRELYDTLRTGTIARRQPVQIYMTTAGHDQTSICYEVYDYAKKVYDGTIEDPTFYPVLYEATLEDDWTKEETWKKANPNYGISVYPSYFYEEVAKARRNPLLENTFKRLHLNIWTEAETRAFNMECWRRSGNIKIDINSLRGLPCWIGLDLSSTTDLTAMALIFKLGDLWVPLMRYWCPEKAIKQANAPKRGNAPYDMWVKQGLLTPTKGGKVDYSKVRAEINEVNKIYEVKEIGVDPWNAHQLTTELSEEDGFTVAEVRQTSYYLSAATKELIASVAEEKVAHGGHQILGWNASNCSTHEDSKGNVIPSKEHSPLKIDGITALVTGMSRAIVAPNEVSVYAERGVLAF